MLPDPVVLCDGGDLVEGVGSSLAYASMPIPVEVVDGKVKLVINSRGDPILCKLGVANVEVQQ